MESDVVIDKSSDVAELPSCADAGAANAAPNRNAVKMAVAMRERSDFFRVMPMMFPNEYSILFKRAAGVGLAPVVQALFNRLRCTFLQLYLGSSARDAPPEAMLRLWFANGWSAKESTPKVLIMLSFLEV